MEEIREINCSVTGRPTPVITWKMKKPLQIKPKSHMILHSNKTVTVISMFTQVLSKTVSENSVICVIQHPSLNTSQELTLPEIVSKQGGFKVRKFLCFPSLSLSFFLFLSPFPATTLFSLVLP